MTQGVVADFARELAAVGAVGGSLEDGRPDATPTEPDLHAAKICAVALRRPPVLRSEPAPTRTG